MTIIYPYSVLARINLFVIISKMKTLVISNWQGRLGNNIMQVLNCILISLTHNYNIKLPPHPYFNTTTININDTSNTNYEYGTYFVSIDDKLYKEQIVPAINILRSIFNRPIPIPLGDNEVVIHIRSGDIFSKEI